MRLPVSVPVRFSPPTLVTGLLVVLLGWPGLGAVPAALAQPNRPATPDPIDEPNQVPPDEPAVEEAPGQGVDKQEGLNFFDTGPLRIREQFLLTQGFLAFDPASADVLGRGRWQFDFVQSATNSWVMSEAVELALGAREARGPLTLDQLRAIEPEGERQGIYFTDGELYRASFAVRVGLGKGVQLGVTIPVLDFRGGFADGLIESFHDSTGFSQAGRTGVPKNRYTVYIRDPEGNELFRDRDPGAGVGDITLSLKGRIPVAAEKWRLALEGLAKLDTGDEQDLYASGGEDYGAQIHVTRYFDKSCIHASAGAMQLGESEVFHLDEQTLLSGMIGYERAPGSTLSLIGQLTVSQSPFQDLEIEGLDDVAFLVDFGVKKGFNEHLVGFLALSENFLTFGNTADFGLHLGFTQTL